MRRWLVLVLAMPVYIFVMMVAGTCGPVALMSDDWVDLHPQSVVEAIGDIVLDASWWSTVGPIALVLVGTQVVFLIPVLAKRPPKAVRSRPLVVSLFIGGAVAAGLTLGLALAAGEFSATVLEWSFDLDDTFTEALFVVLLVGSWAFWSAVLLVFCRGIWADRMLGRVVGLLIGGTLLEVLVVLPLDIMVRRRTDCYCFSGTFFGLCLATGATLWLTGPGIVIALTSKKHRQWRELHCFRCGYAKGPSPGPVCPECGYAWLEAARTNK